MQKKVHNQQQVEASHRKTLMNKKVREFIPDQFQQKAVLICKFCGGSSCKQQDFRTNKIQPNAIQGLHSNWITHNILAMQRPSERLIKEYRLYEKFKKQKINTILNLQQPGEHSDCGDGLVNKAIGFSYDPQGFYNQGIRFFNESWQDMTATTFQHMMRIMNIFYMSLIKDEGKISVHCHAGRGRTLLVICSWLIYWDRLPAKITIDIAVQRRQGVLTKSSQRQFLVDFQQQLKLRWKSYGSVYGKTFSQFVELQKISLLKNEQNVCKFKPYLHSCIITELRRRIEVDPKASRQIMMAMLNCHSDFFKEKWSQENEDKLKQLKQKINNHTLFLKQQELVKKLDVRILTELFYDFYDQLKFTLVTIHALESLVEHSEKMKNKIQALLQPQFVHETGVQAIAVLLDLVHFVKFFVKQNLNLIKQGSEDQKICQSLFIRISILLSSKRKFCPKIFPEKHNYRQCRLMNYEAQKRLKYTSQDQIRFANYLRVLTKQIKQDLSSIESFITSARKVDSNLCYLTQNHDSEEGFIKSSQAKQMYNKSRV